MVHSKANTTHPIHWIHERKTEVEYENERQDSFLFRAVEGNVAPYYASLFFLLPISLILGGKKGLAVGSLFQENMPAWKGLTSVFVLVLDCYKQVHRKKITDNAHCTFKFQYATAIALYLFFIPVLN